MLYTEMNSPMGRLTLLATEKGICRIAFGGVEKNLPALKVWVKQKQLTGDLVQDEIKIAPIVTQLNEYFAGDRQSFDVPVVLYGTTFQKQVWKALTNISYGETKSYKDIAKAIHAPKAIRAVGGAVNKNPVPIIVPCHRVIGSNGALVGYNGGLDKKEQLLLIENALKKIS